VLESVSPILLDCISSDSISFGVAGSGVFSLIIALVSGDLLLSVVHDSVEHEVIVDIKAVIRNNFVNNFI